MHESLQKGLYARRDDDEDAAEDEQKEISEAGPTTTDKRERPWFAPRVILHWVKIVWEKDHHWEFWTIDKYDGEETYQQWELIIPEEMKEDTEAHGCWCHALREELIEVELMQDGSSSMTHVEIHQRDSDKLPPKAFTDCSFECQ